jgi:hypothetical protein
MSIKREEWKDHRIFAQFIKKERDLIVHEYRSEMSTGPVALIAVTVAPDGRELPIDTAVLDQNIYRPMSSGDYENEDGRVLIEDSIEWWCEQLNEIDRLVQAAVAGNTG